METFDFIEVLLIRYLASKDLEMVGSHVVEFPDWGAARSHPSQRDENSGWSSAVLGTLMSRWSASFATHAMYPLTPSGDRYER